MEAPNFNFRAAREFSGLNSQCHLQRASDLRPVTSVGPPCQRHRSCPPRSSSPSTTYCAAPFVAAAAINRRRLHGRAWAELRLAQLDGSAAPAIGGSNLCDSECSTPFVSAPSSLPRCFTPTPRRISMSPASGLCLQRPSKSEPSGLRIWRPRWSLPSLSIHTSI
jgi:hypothetical protein